MKLLADIRPSGVDKHSADGEIPVRLCNYTDVYKNDRIVGDMMFMEATATPAEVERFALRAGDVLITKDSETPDDIAVSALVEASAEGAVCGYHLALLRPKEGIDGGFLAWSLKSREVREQFSIRAQGVTRFGLTTGGMGKVLVPMPPSAEQCAITTFLDCETAKIDALVAEQVHLIKMLKEKRQAATTQAVTKGLFLNLELKTSGIEWLGDVPNDWIVMRLGALFDEVDEEGQADLPVLSVSIHDGVSNRELTDVELERKVTRSEDRSKYKKVEPGDLVYNMMRAWQGGFGTVAVAGMVSPAYVVARPRIVFRTQFIELLLRTPKAIEEMRRHSHGVADFRMRLYWDDFKQIRVALPPVDEQVHILEALSGLVCQVDELITETQRTIKLLKERRSALISAAVTGKIDVRGAISAIQEAA